MKRASRSVEPGPEAGELDSHIPRAIAEEPKGARLLLHAYIDEFRRHWTRVAEQVGAGVDLGRRHAAHFFAGTPEEQLVVARGFYSLESAGFNARRTDLEIVEAAAPWLDAYLVEVCDAQPFARYSRSAESPGIQTPDGGGKGRAKEDSDSPSSSGRSSSRPGRRRAQLLRQVVKAEYITVVRSSVAVYPPSGDVPYDDLFERMGCGGQTVRGEARIYLSTGDEFTSDERSMAEAGIESDFRAITKDAGDEPSAWLLSFGGDDEPTCIEFEARDAEYFDE